MNRKGFLFTIFTLMMLISLFLITLAYVEWFENYKFNNADLSNSKRINFFKDDIGSDIKNILDFDDLTIKRENGEIEFEFENFFNSSKDYNLLLNEYESFIEEDYNSYFGNAIDLNLNNSFLLNPYNISYNTYSNDAYLYINSINGANLEILIYNSSSLSGTSVPSDMGGDYPLVKVRFIDRNGYTFLNSERRLDINNSNGNFECDFNGNKVYINFGNGRIRVHFEENININNYDFTLIEQNSSYYLNSGSMMIDSKDIAFNGPITIFKG